MNLAKVEMQPVTHWSEQQPRVHLSALLEAMDPVLLDTSN
jgi:hypothetical protein